MNKKILSRLEENWLIAGVAILIIYLFFFKNSKEVNQNQEITYGENTPYTVIYSDEVKKGDILLSGSIDGIDIYENNEKLGSLGEKDIEEFISTLDKGQSYILNNDISTHDFISQNNIGIIIDNTYSYIADYLDTSLPNKRLERAINYILTDLNITENTEGSLGWLFAHKYGTSEEKMNSDVFSFKIDPANAKIKIINKGDIDITYVKNYKKLVINSINLKRGVNSNGTGSSVCTYISTFDFICRNKQDFVKEIQNIYTTHYSEGNDYHQGTFLLDYLKTKDFYNFDNIYIFTDGEFQIQKASDKYISSINNSYKLKSSLILNAQEYRKYNYYEKYWDNISPLLNKNLTQCQNQSTAITFVGLNSDTVAFKNFTVDTYLKIFEGCDVSFKS